jgi:hypothetical protein
VSQVERVSAAVDFYNVVFNQVKARYLVRSSRRKIPNWRSLRTVQSCVLKDEVFRNNDYVQIFCEDAEDPGSDTFVRIREIREIRAVPSEDVRYLVRVAWLYEIGGKYYNSNHFQILLWDTIDGHMGHDDVGMIEPDKLYDACLTCKVCDESQRQRWQTLEAQAFETTGESK